MRGLRFQLNRGLRFEINIMTFYHLMIIATIIHHHDVFRMVMIADLMLMMIITITIIR